MSIRIMTAVWESSPYDGARLLLHLAMADHANDQGWFFAAQDTLARKARCSVEYVRLSVNRMVEDGVLIVERKGSSRGRATEYRLMPLPNTVGGTPTAVTEELPNTVGDNSPTLTDNSPTLLGDNRPIQPSYNLQTPDTAEAVPPETAGQRVNRLAKTYTDLVPLSNFPAVAGVVRKAVKAGYPDDRITDALTRMADEGRSVTVDALRYEMDGKPATSRRESGASMFARLAGSDVRELGA